MPKIATDPKTCVIFGMNLPWLATLIDYGKGIWNFVTVGLPNAWGKISGFFAGVKEFLFGKKGIFRDAAEMKRSLRRIFNALLIGLAKKVQSFLCGILATVLHAIPYVGPFLSFLVKLIPAIQSYIACELSNKSTQEFAEAERARNRFYEKKVSGGIRIKENQRLRKNLMEAGSGIQPFVGISQIPGLQTPKTKFGRPERAAIMRHVEIKEYRSKTTNTGVSEAAVQYARQWNAQREEIRSYKAGGSRRGELEKRVYEFKPEGGNLFDKLMFLHERVLQQGGAGHGGARISYWRAQVEKLIAPEVKRLFNYKAELSKKWKARWADNGEPLYYTKGPHRGWNPRYRVVESDLKSKIPFEPYQEMHESEDVTLGEPFPDPEEMSQKKGNGGYGVGYLPMKWMQRNNVIYQDPYIFRLEKIDTAIRAWRQLGAAIIGDFIPPGWSKENEEIAKQGVVTHGTAVSVQKVPSKKELLDILAISLEKICNIGGGSRSIFQFYFLGDWIQSNYAKNARENNYFQRESTGDNIPLFGAFYLKMKAGAVTRDINKFSFVNSIHVNRATDDLDAAPQVG